MSFHFMRPEWLWLLLPAAVLTLLLWRARRHSGGWSAVISPALLPHLVTGRDAGRHPGVLPLLLLGWILAAIAASGPSWEKIPQPVMRKQDALVVLLDLSASMKAADLAPSRADRARRKVLDLLERRREGQTAVVAFAGDAHVVTPLTDDTGTIANLLPALHPDMMPVPGSDAAGAVAEGLELLRSAGVRGGDLLLVTDGVDAADRAAIAEALRGSGARLSILGVGTATGAPIPLPLGGFLRDAGGAIVMPGLEPRGLRELAAAGGGRYRDMHIDNSDLDALLAARGPAGGDILEDARRADAWADMGHLFLLPLLPLVLALFRRGWLLALVPVLFAAQPQGVRAGPWEDLWLTRDQQAQRALQAGDAQRAAELFEQPDWAGAAAYRGGDYAAAAERFAESDDADAWYNRGNALARAGRLDEAIAAFEQSLAREPGREDAQKNLELVQTLRDRQQQQGQQAQQDDGEGDGQSPADPQTGEGQQARDQGQSRSGGDQTGDNEPGERPGDQRAGERGAAQSEPRGAGARGEDDPADTPGGASPQGGQEDAGAQREQAARPGETADGEEPESAAEVGRAPGDAADTERDQALEQWLRRVPDDPSGLLREKFRYESQQRERAGNGGDNAQPW